MPTLRCVAGPCAQEALQNEGETTDPEHWPLRSYLEFAALPTAVPCARLHAKNILHEWRMAHLTATVELLVSEIVTNAVRASAGRAHRQHAPEQAISVPTVRFWLTSNGHRVLIQVWDSDDNIPVPQTVGLDAESGRGLLLIETLSSKWGCYTAGNQDGKIVWAMCISGVQSTDGEPSLAFVGE
jgi:anti-sigma regulatory factor (Ser/Thr protein kinase)